MSKPKEPTSLADLGLTTLLTPDDVAAWFRVPKDLIYDMVQQHRIPFVRVGSRQLRFRRGELEAWLEANSSTAETDS